MRSNLLIILNFFLLITTGLSQANIERVFYPSAQQLYGIENGLPDRCVFYSFVDSLGKLMVIPCFHAQISYDVSFYQLDGFKPLQKNIIDSGLDDFSYLHPIGFNNNINYGYLFKRTQEMARENYAFYEFNPISGQFDHYNLPTLEGKKLRIGSAIKNDKGYDLLCHTDQDMVIVNFESGRMRILGSFKVLKKIPSATRNYPFLKVKDFYYASDLYNLYRFDPIQQTVEKIFTIDKDVRDPHLVITRFIETLEGEQFIYLSKVDQVFKLNRKSGQFEDFRYSVPKAYKGNIKKMGLFLDELSNILLIFEYFDGSKKGLIRSQLGQYSDYSAVIQSFDDIGWEYGIDLNYYSTDFTKQVVKAAYNFQIVDVTSNEGIQKIESSAMRGIHHLVNEHYYLGGSRILEIDSTGLQIQNGVLDCKDEYMYDGVIEKDNGGRIIEPRLNRLYKIDPITLECSEFNFGRNILRYKIIPDSDEYIIVSNRKLYTWNTETNQQRLLSDSDVPGYVNQIFLFEEEVYLVTSIGLYQLDRMKNKDFKLVHPSLRVPINMMTSDDQGRFWLGTFAEGVWIFDPRTEDLMIVDESKGLSDNTVAVLEKDNEGDLWIGTFNGITIIDQNLNIIGHVYEADGLVNNECNRWSIFKNQDGLLFFGSVAGISIIDPIQYKQKINEDDPVKIYLTSLSFGDSTIVEGTMSIVSNLDKGIYLPAANRNLKVSYGLSRYTNPTSSSFAYRLETVSDQWNFIGNIHELSLVDLPRGSYNLLIKGSDYRGVPTINTIRVPLIVGSYFYQTWWFVLICVFLVTTLLIAWSIRQKRLRQLLEQEVDKRTYTIQKQTEELEELDRLKSKLYTNITHEFRTPLTIIDGLSKQLDSDSKISEMIRRNTQSLLSLVNQMLDLRKLESGKMLHNPIQSDLSYYLRYIGESFEPIANSNEVELLYEVPEDELICDFDPDQVLKIISNLVYNAIKNTLKGGYVKIGLKEDKAVLQIMVKDNGVGIPKENLTNIFNRYYQIGNANSQAGIGTGIGLTIVKELVALMNGQMHVASEEGYGTTFIIKLPKSNQAEFKTKLDFSSIHQWSASFPINGKQEKEQIDLNNQSKDKPTVLIVEDNADVMHYLILCLNENYYILKAHNGEEGRSIALQTMPTIIISDIMMPVMDGYEFCRQLKSDIRTSHIPIIMLTAKADQESKLDGLKLGADGYMMKPFDKEELLLRISNLLTMRKALQERYNKLENINDAVSLPNREDQFILHFRSVVQKNIDSENFGIQEMCRAMGMGRTHLHEKIKTLTGKTPIQYQKMIKMHEATILLNHSKANISEIAYQLGFKDPKYFSKVFKEEYGTSPSNYHQSSSSDN
ncbi:hybrid sensor histidine kinase/response regulator transcription factor [Portibacter marinus]|uniref:hybrid sensor histidine kinase/response regulator transcription factor n=1 Tax=Portibacter marinus TaxID=2898660 RepID=UPI001F1A663C|nr:ATP-binding protein [Portibacter marinus]